MTQHSPLDGLVVADLTGTLAGSYCTKLWADAGAEVVKLEPEGGDPVRRYSALGVVDDEGGSPMFRFLCAGKDSVVADLSRPEGRRLVAEVAASADLVVEAGPPGALSELGLGVEALQARRPSLTMVSITPFGQHGPWALRPATEFTMQAAVGSLQLRGLPDRSPLAAGGRLGDWAAGTWAAVAGLAAWRRARASGLGDHVDVSEFECMAVTLNPYEWLHADLTGDPERFLTQVFSRSVEIPSIEPAKDGFVGFALLSAQQWKDFTVMIERPGMGEDPALAQQLDRWPRRVEVEAAVQAWTRERTVDEIVDLAGAYRIPVAPIGNGANIAGMGHFVANGTFVAVPGTQLIGPRVPYRMSGSTLPGLGPAPALGAGRGERPEGEPGTVPEAEPLPLSDVKVADFSALWAGPMATVILGCLGADVVKIESVQRPDAIRYTSSRPPDVEQWWEYSWIFHAANPNKRGVTVDLSRPAGLDLARRLIERSDVVIENFSPRVFESFGLDGAGVAAINPQAVFVRMPAFGLSGPWRDRVGLAMTMEQLSGLANVTGYEDGPPINPRGPCDAIAGVHACLATLVALIDRDRTGRGQMVESVMVDAALNVAAEQVLEYSAHGNVFGRQGNRDAAKRPQGLYRCRGDDEWLAVATETSEQWLALVDWLGSPDWAGPLGWALHNKEEGALDELDARLGAVLAECDVATAVEELSGRGVPAEAAILPGRLGDNPQLLARHFFEVLDHPVAGRQRYPGLPFRLARGPAHWHHAPPPVLGQHNDEVLGGDLGLSAAELSQLAEDHVIGDRPAGL
ncbi:MAG TPA: CoA transferase [Acidimicrobiales bacterium]|nr:CoA transferase [Acidimicrobiales bacterium]